MRTSLRVAAGLLIASSIVSCQKSTELDPAVFEMDLESKSVKKNLQVGMEYQGGIIFYLDETGKHGLITAKEDVGPAPWGCYGTSFFDISMAISTKTANKILLSGCKEPGIAARLCAQYQVREKGRNGRVYKDWYMAGFGELREIIKVLPPVEALCARTYWTFMEATNWQAAPLNPGKSAFITNFACAGYPGPVAWYPFHYPRPKTESYYARPIRSF